jgi:CTP:molybdopterin cytidylyltransferase MocA
MIAAITAGGRVDGAFAEAIGTDVKALAPFGAGTLLDVVLAAAADCGATRVVVVGGQDVRSRCEGAVDAVIPESPSGRENLRRALEAAQDDELLLLASDLPFVRARDLGTFLERSRGHDIALPLASVTEYRAVFPDAPAHGTRLGGECVVNGSAFYFGPGVAPKALAAAQRLFDARKSLWRMAALLGPSLLLRFATNRLRIDHVEARALGALGVRARAVRRQAPHLCYDVDTLEDYRYAREHARRL